jgi:hypothetical protein
VLKRRASKISRLIAVLTTTAILFMGHPQPSLAAQWHGFSSAREFSLGSGYTGLKVRRSVLTSINFASCSNLYDTMWVYPDFSAGIWLEMPTNYRCNGQGNREVVTLIGYGLGWNWYLIKTLYVGVSPGDHSYTIKQDYGGDFKWDFLIDGQNVHANQSFSGGDTAERLHTGLETWDDEHIVPMHNVHDLLFRRNANNFVDWSGRDGTNLSGGPMCGFWVTDTSWREGENVC